MEFGGYTAELEINRVNSWRCGTVETAARQDSQPELDPLGDLQC